MTEPNQAPAVAKHPVVAQEIEERASNAQLRLADAITRFAGSMAFVYLHVAAFAVWMLFAEGEPWPTLTLVVSLEAIFLSTFVMIGQNRLAIFAKRQADHDFVQQEQELRTNTELTREIRRLTIELNRRLIADEAATLRAVRPDDPGEPDPSPQHRP